jgi:hypothetical protein
MDYTEVFYEAAQQKGGPAGQQFQGFPIGVVEGCIWMDGVHVYCENPNCPEISNSELGEQKPVGWTVQQI